MWQDFVFMAGSSLSVLFLAPTIRDTSARVPLATSLPSMLVGGVYSMTFLTLGMTFSALGAAATCTMWTLIAALRSPRSPLSGGGVGQRVVRGLALFGADLKRWLARLRSEDGVEQFVIDPQSSDRFQPADD
ncbi:hypothetical protein SAMN06269185_1375 [Natronoarchaeum philippinense]|uniref:Uncharacterized protein n=2 Tax=Natronoarchaeum philippinense TaxID=558529 RepID=A0A285NVL2_NATPI|nr:hypothetical protein [Natronoarchaeum philippinense]SNZ11691.1 hypothetical protein SAMN06269185_1375 [Natronoarchaeum philippinense]